MIRATDACLPIVAGVGPPSDDALVTLIQQHRSRRPFALIVDVDVCARPPHGSRTTRGRQTDVRRALDAPTAIAQVASSPRMRNASIAMYGADAPRNLRVFDSEDAAIGWTLRRLTQANVTSLPSPERIQDALRQLRRDYVDTDDRDESSGSASAHMLDEIAGVLRMIQQPAFVVRADGSLIAANAAGQRKRRASTWLAEVTGTKTRDREACAKVYRLRGHDAYVVLPIRPWEVPEHLAGVLKPWPPRLRETAELLLEGLTDKEIARRLNTSHATARTYVIRVFRRCGVHSRAELLSL